MGWAAAIPAAHSRRIDFFMGSKCKLQGDLHLSRRRRGAGDATHRRGIQRSARRGKTRRVRKVERLPPELQARALAQLELLEDRKVDGAQNVRRKDAQAGV